MCGLEIVSDEFGSDLIVIEHHGADPYEIDWTFDRFYSFYGFIGFPTVVFDGMAEHVGAFLDCELMADYYREAIQARWAETGGVSPVAIEGFCSLDDVQIHVAASIELVDPVTIVDAQATVMILEDGLIFDGETYNDVTRFGSDQAIALDDVGQVVEIDLTIPLNPDWNPHRLRCMVLVQRTTGDQEVHQAAELLRGITGIGSYVAQSARSGIIGIWPNPFVVTSSAGGRVHFALAPSEPAQRSSAISLDIIDVRGRQIRSLDARSGTGPLSRLQWDGRDERGELVSSGVYCARLRTFEGESSRRFLVLK